MPESLFFILTSLKLNFEVGQLVRIVGHRQRVSRF